MRLLRHRLRRQAAPARRVRRRSTAAPPRRSNSTPSRSASTRDSAGSACSPAASVEPAMSWSVGQSRRPAGSTSTSGRSRASSKASPSISRTSRLIRPARRWRERSQPRRVRVCAGTQVVLARAWQNVDHQWLLDPLPGPTRRRSWARRSRSAISRTAPGRRAGSTPTPASTSRVDAVQASCTGAITLAPADSLSKDVALRMER